MLFGVFQLSVPQLLLVGVVATILTLGFAKLRQNWKIRKLGGHAAQLPSYTLLFGISKSSC